MTSFSKEESLKRDRVWGSEQAFERPAPAAQLSAVACGRFGLSCGRNFSRPPGYRLRRRGGRFTSNAPVGRWKFAYPTSYARRSHIPETVKHKSGPQPKRKAPAKGAFLFGIQSPILYNAPLLGGMVHLFPQLNCIFKGMLQF